MTRVDRKISSEPFTFLSVGLEVSRVIRRCDVVNENFCTCK